MKNDDVSAFGTNEKTKSEWFDYLMDETLRNLKKALTKEPYSVSSTKSINNYKELLINELKEQFNEITEPGTYVIFHRKAVLNISWVGLDKEYYHMEKCSKEIIVSSV